ncbi:MAG: pilus assembly PilX N-terminal domain-containing protein [Candidatus Wallbacteria bacterium]|nr:pilus assembly PilX N-terminal domain-containing protein [Candidatus Wallbacteria bacterium]
MDKKGNTLLVVFIIISVLTFLGISFNSLVSTDVGISENKGDYLKAEYLAQSGIEVALQRIIDFPDVTSNYLSFLRGCTIESSSNYNTFSYDPRNAIGGYYPLTSPTDLFKFAAGDTEQRLTVNLHQIVSLNYITSYQNPKTLGSNFRIQTREHDYDSWTTWCSIDNPQGSILVAENKAKVKVGFIEVFYGQQVQGAGPTEVIELFGYDYTHVPDKTDSNFSLYLEGFTDPDQASNKTFIKYQIQGNRILCTARLMQKSFRWVTKSIASLEIYFVMQNQELTVVSKNFTTEYLPIKSSLTDLHWIDYEVEKSDYLNWQTAD